MKRFVIMFLLLCLAGIMVSAQETVQKQLFDSQSRVIRDESGNRITYKDRINPRPGGVADDFTRGEKTGDAVSTIAVCAPQWFQGTMGSCIGVNSMITEDIDHDGKTEIICGGGSGFGSGLFWYVMKYDAASQDYEQTWMSTPLDYSSGDPLFSCIRAFDVDSDNIFEIFVGYQDGTVEIYKGAGMDMISVFASGGSDVNDILFADADNDGQKEIVLCDDDHTYLFNSSSFELEDIVAYGSYRFAAGNVDADPGNEIVYSNGTVISLTQNTVVVDWNIFTPPLNYALVALTDIENDGMEEIVIANAWYSIEVYDADIKALKGTITSDLDIDAMIVADVNGDTKKEILYGDGQWGDVYCYNSLTLQLMWSIPNPEHGVTQMAVTDTDNDGQLEVLWGAGCSSTGADYLYIHNIANQAFEFQSADISGPFFDVETGDVDGDGQDEIVTVSYESVQGYESGILSIFDGTTGNLDWQSNGSFFPETWQGIHCLKLINLTGDVTKEIVVGASYLYDGAAYIVNGVTHQKISSKVFSSEGIESLLGLDVADVDNDGTPELVTADINNLFVINPNTFAIEWTSPSVSGYGTKSVMTGNLDSDPNLEMVVCKGYVTVFDGITHAQWTSTESNCTNIDLYDWNNDGVLEIIACTGDGKILLMDRQANLTVMLVQFGALQIDGVRMVNLDGAGLPEYVFTSGGRIYFANSDGDLVATNSFGSGAGSFDGLKLSDINNDGLLEIFAGTACQVVQISEECSQCLGFKVVAESIAASCVPGNDGIATATVTAGTLPYSYQWSNGMTLQSITGLAPGQYTIQVTDSKGCPAQDTVNIAQSRIVVSISGKDVGCHGIQDGTAAIGIITGTSPYQFSWNNGGTQQNLTGLSPGTYICTITDHMGCSATRNITILKDTVRINLITQDPHCYGDGGLAMVQILSGTPPFVYMWGDIQGGSVINNLEPGNYLMTVRDTLNCMASREFTITGPPPITGSVSVVPDDPGTASPDGQATIVASGGTPPYYYQWNDPYHQTNSTATNLAAGHYTVVVTDYTGCHQDFGVDLYGLHVDGVGPEKAGLKAFPNPASDVIYVSTGFSGAASGIIELVNAAGVVVDCREYNANGPAAASFDVKRLPASIYLVVVHAGDKTLTTRVIIER